MLRAGTKVSTVQIKTYLKKYIYLIIYFIYTKKNYCHRFIYRLIVFIQYTTIYT